VAVGGFEDQVGAEHLLAMSWDGSEWQAHQGSLVEGDELHEYSEGEGEGEGEAEGGVSSPYTSLSAISCASASSCIAVGSRPATSTNPPLIVSWDGDSWGEEPPAEYAPGGSGFHLAAVACHEESRCAAVGSASFGGFPAKNFSLSYEQGVWLTPYFPTPGGGLRGVSCSEAESCLAVGDGIDPGGDPARAWTLQDDGWEASATAPVSGAFLSDVSCTTKSQCTAIGREGAWPFEPLAERWDGEQWSTQAIPSPSGRSANPEAVSCSTASFCVAAGFSWPATGAGPATALVQSWNGSSWTTASPSLPAGAASSFLYDVACASASSCVAAGTYTDSAGISHGLILRWNGSSWTSSSISPPEGYEYTLRGVDCTSSTACTAVGSAMQTTSYSSGPIAYRWNGSTWSLQTVPTPGGARGLLRSVDCYSSTRCVAVGATSDAAGQDPLIVGWQEGAWHHELSPRVSGNSSTALESVSCFSAADCTAVGMAQFTDGPRELLVVQTEGEDPESDDPTAVAGETVPKFSAEQKAAALDILSEDPNLQATIGVSEYEPLIGPWTEVDEETGDVVLVGAYIEVVFEEPESWPQRSWPTAEYELSANGYEAGAFAEADLHAAAETIQSLQVSLDLAFDEAVIPIEGEAVEIVPRPGTLGEIAISPESFGKYDAAVAGY
jgi:hypothetical protein